MQMCHFFQIIFVKSIYENIETLQYFLQDCVCRMFPENIGHKDDFSKV